MTFFQQKLKPNQLVCILVLLILIYSYFFLQKEALFFDRQAILEGEVWRLLTCGFSHVSVNHLTMNAFAFFLSMLLFGSQLNYITAFFMLLYTNLFVSICLLLFTDLQYYLGLSGALYGCILIMCYLEAKRGDTFALFVIVYVVIRIFFQQIDSDQIAFSEFIGSKIIAVEAHFFGMLAALLWTLARECPIFCVKTLSPK